MLRGAVTDSSRVVSCPSRTCGACVLKEELEWRRAESKMRRWSSGRRLEAGEVDVLCAEMRSRMWIVKARRGHSQETGTHHVKTPLPITHKTEELLLLL